MSIFKVFGRSKHKKLNEEWGDSIKTPLEDGISFHCKYLGSTLIEKPSDSNATADAIKTIIAMTKLSNRSLAKVSLTIKPTGITTHDMMHNEKYLDISIYKISYCSADATFDRVVAFIATNENETHECHAFLTPKYEIARACALTIFQAFTVAYEKYKKEKEEKEAKQQHQTDEQVDGKDAEIRKLKGGGGESLRTSETIDEMIKFDPLPQCPDFITINTPPRTDFSKVDLLSCWED